MLATCLMGVLIAIRHSFRQAATEGYRYGGYSCTSTIIQKWAQPSGKAQLNLIKLNS